MLGRGKYCARWGYSCNIGDITQNLPTCSTCMENAGQYGIDYVNDNDYCSICTNWETCSDHPLLQTMAPSKYPYEMLLNDTYIVPFKLNYDMLQDALSKAHTKLTSSLWTVDEVKQYLWVYGINNDAVASIIEHATNEKLYAYAERNKDTMPHEFNVMK